MEGDWEHKRIVIIEFPSYEIATSWWNSEEYRKAMELREKGTTTKAIIVDGV